jgi:hypothetical protein
MHLKVNSLQSHFGSVAMKKAMVASCRRLLHFGSIATKKVTTIATIAFFLLQRKR